MKTNHKIAQLMLLTMVFMLSACQNTSEEPKVVIKRANIIKQVLAVDGMTCMGCEITLEKNVSQISGVVKVKASSDEKKMTVEYDKTKTNLTEIIKKVKDAGYTPMDLIDVGAS